MSPPSPTAECPSALLNYAHFAGAPRPDSKGRAPCPLCGKTVQLLARGRVPIKTYIPRHKRAQPAAAAAMASTTGASAQA